MHALSKKSPRYHAGEDRVAISPRMSKSLEGRNSNRSPFGRRFCRLKTLKSAQSASTYGSRESAVRIQGEFYFVGD